MALLELPRGLTQTELAGGFGLPGLSTFPQRIEEIFRRQLLPLAAPTRELLLVSAADPVGDPVLTWRAAGMLGIGVGAAAPAATAGLLEIDSYVRFRHPLLRSVIYRSASPEQRQTVHRALSEATDPTADPIAAPGTAPKPPGPDDEIAAELELSANRAQTRAGDSPQRARS